MTMAASMPRPLLARVARPLVWIAMPALGVGVQYCAERLAHGLGATPFGAAWLAQVLHSPWMGAWVGLEIVAFTAWMIVLSQLALSAAFPMTALGYMLVIGLGWTVFREPVNVLQIVGGAAILWGVRLLAEEPQP